MSTPPNMLQLFQQPAEQTTEYAAGFSQMVQHLIEEDAANQNAYLAQLGSPQEIEAANIGDTLNAFGGFFPATAMNDAAQSWQAFANALPSLQSAQLGQSASLHAQELANQRSLASMEMDHARQMAAADLAASQASGGDGGGLTPYQAASLEMRAMEFATEQDRYAQQDELDWLKFEAELEQEEMERRQREDTAAFDSLLYQGIFMLAAGEDPFKNKKFMAALSQASGLGSSSAANAFASAATGASGDRADAAADARAGRQDRREDLRGLISFDGINDGLGKDDVVSSIMSNIRTQYPNFVGMKPAKVRSEVRTYVNDNWANYRAGGRNTSPGRGGFNKQWDTFEAGSALRSAYKDYVSSLGEGRFGVRPKPSYKTAFARTMGAVRAKWGGKWNPRVRTQVAKRVHSYLKSQGLRRPPRRRPPRRPPRGARNYPGRN